MEVAINKMFKAFRRSVILNKLIRNMLVIGENMIGKLSKRWKVAGIVSIEIEQVKARFYSNCDDPIIDCLYYRRYYEEQSDLMLFMNLAKKANCVLDIGAYTGLYSVFSAMVNPSAYVFAFEPSASNYKRLEFNKHINSLKNLKTIPFAVGQSDSMVKFYSPPGDSLSDTSSVNLAFSQSTYGGQLKWEERRIQSIALDSFIKQENIARVDLIKIDVESNEINVFEGLQKTIERDRPTILCEIFLNEERINYFDSLVARYDYSLYSVLKEGIIRLDTGISINHNGLNYLLTPFKTNQIFTSFRKIEDINDLLEKYINTR